MLGEFSTITSSKIFSYHFFFSFSSSAAAKSLQSCLTLCDPRDGSPPGSSVPGILFFFWDPCNSNVGAFDIVPEVSETILSSFHSFHFILLFRSYFHHFIFQLTDSFFCFRYSAIDSFQSIFNFSNCVVCLCMFIL